ncbi:aminoacyl-tRNA hydrolase [soil metagenome]
MKLIVGLGNPGEKYESTRHNLGFRVVERFFKDTQPLKATGWDESRKLKSNFAKIAVQGEEIILAKPKTFMNESGMAVSLIAQFYKIKPEDIWVIYDELDLPLGSLRIRFGGAAGGHHGVESIMESVGTDKFWRFRLGIGVNPHVTLNKVDGEKEHESVGRHKVHNGAEFVLGTFTTKEVSEIKKVVKHTSEALQVAIEKGLDKAQNQFNTK